MERRELKVTSNINIEGATIVCRNFQGKGGKYNNSGNRNFGVLLDDELAEDLQKDGWKVKYFKPRPDDPEQHAQAWLSVKVKFEKFPPIAVLITSKGKKRLTEETIGQLDWTRIENCDLIIRPYNYPASETIPAGVAAYLKAIYVTVQEDDFEAKYADIPDLDADEEEAPFD